MAFKANMREREERHATDHVKKNEKKSLIGKAKDLLTGDGDEEKKAKATKAATRQKPLSASEAEALREPYLRALLDYFRYADELIYATNKAHERVDIWSSIDHEDAAFLVDVHLRCARQSAKAAQHIVALTHKHEELRVAAIALPRAYQTFMVYMQYGLGVR